MSITSGTDVTVNPSPKTTVEVHVPDYIANNDPLAAQAGNIAARVTQQQIIPSAVQDRFVNILKQWPAPVNQNEIVTSDMGTATALIGDGTGGNAAPAVNFAFTFTNTIAQYSSVELATSIFIDDKNIYNVYPVGANVSPLDWNVERLKTTHHLTQRNTVYSVNQANQVAENLIIKFLGSGNHRLYVFYYWRYFSNQGGTKS